MKLTGIDVHKQIYTTYVLDDNEKVIDELNDLSTSDDGLCEPTARYGPNDCVMLFEDLTRAHLIYHWFSAKGYDVTVVHTGHGSLQTIYSNFISDPHFSSYDIRTDP